MLNKLKMPMKKPMDLAELKDQGADEAPAEGSPEEEAMESPAEEAQEMSQLDQVSDEELLAELKKRGLMGDDMEAGAPDMSADYEEAPKA